MLKYLRLFDIICLQHSNACQRTANKKEKMALKYAVRTEQTQQGNLRRQEVNFVLFTLRVQVDFYKGNFAIVCNAVKMHICYVSRAKFYVPRLQIRHAEK